jgi:hypothetical protein
MSDSEQASSAPPRRRRWFLLVPAATFLVGLLLGALLVWVVQPTGPQSDDQTAEPTPEGTLEPSPEPRTTPSPSVSEACLRAAGHATELVTLVRQAANALGDLDTLRLQEIVDDMERLDGEIRAAVDQCRQRAAGSATPEP